jgi:hypothetical protein
MRQEVSREPAGTDERDGRALSRERGRQEEQDRQSRQGRQDRGSTRQSTEQDDDTDRQRDRQQQRHQQKSARARLGGDWFVTDWLV